MRQRSADRGRRQSPARGPIGPDPPPWRSCTDVQATRPTWRGRRLVPGTPSTWSSGTKTSVRCRTDSLLPSCPNMGMTPPISNPGDQVGTTNALIPPFRSCAATRSVTAKTMARSACAPLLIHCLVPFTIQPPSVGSAAACIIQPSLPASGSDMAKHMDVVPAPQVR